MNQVLRRLRAALARPSGRELIPPSGAAIAAVCFFLPWVRVSCLRHLEFTGAEVAGLRGQYWLVLIGAVAVVVAWVLGRLGLLPRARAVMAACATGALAVIFGPLLAGQKPRGLDLQVEVGAYGTVLGLLAAALGVVDWTRARAWGARVSAAAVAWRNRAIRAGRHPRGTGPSSSPPRSGTA